MKRHPYITATLIATLLAMVVWICMPKEYTATTKLSDEYQETDLAIGLTLLQKKIKEVNGSANTGLNDMEVYCKVLKTEDFARKISHKQVYGKKQTYGKYLGVEDTIEVIKKHINYNYSNRQETLIIGFTDREATVASQMLDSVTVELQQFITQYRHKIAESALRDTNVELNAAKKKYVKAMNAYTSFADTHINAIDRTSIQEEKALEKDMLAAEAYFQKVSKEYVRQQALLKRSYCSFAVIQDNTVPSTPNTYFISYLFTFIFIALTCVKGFRLYRKRKEKQDYHIDWGGLFSPWTISILIWAALLGMYYLFDTDLYPISSQFYLCFSIWIPIFSSCALMTYNLLPANTGTTQPIGIDINKCIFIFFLILSIILTPIYIYRIMQIVTMFSSNNLMNDIRILALWGEGQGSLGHVNVINQALFIIALWNYPKTPLWQVLLIMLACLLCSLAIMEKGTIFFVFTCIIFVLHEKGTIKLQSIIIWSILLVFFFYIFNILRSFTEDYDSSDETFVDFISMYILSPPVAFSQLSPELVQQFGTNTFESIYHYLVRFGSSSFVEKQKIQEFVFVPISTNVYTIFQPFYIDFGLRGIAFFSMFYGILCGWAYRLFRNNHNWGTCMYTFLFNILVLQFYQENLFLSLNITIEISFFLYLMCMTQNKWAFRAMYAI